MQNNFKNDFYQFLNKNFTQNEILCLTTGFKWWRTFNRDYVQYDSVAFKSPIYKMVHYIKTTEGDGEIKVMNRAKGHKNCRKLTIVGFRIFFGRVDIIGALNYQKKVLLIIFGKFMRGKVGHGFFRRFLDLVYEFF